MSIESQNGVLLEWGCATRSILRPLLFSLLVNDLPNVAVHVCVNVYADDTELHCSGDDFHQVQDDFQSDLYRIQTWLQANRLQLNVSKSVVMLLGS